jgi:hypothetical protein
MFGALIMLCLSVCGASVALVGGVQLFAAAVWTLALVRRGRRAVVGVWRARGRGWALERSDGTIVVVRGALSPVAVSDGTRGGAVGRVTTIATTDEGPYRSSTPSTFVEVRGAYDVWVGDLPFAADRESARTLAIRGAKRLAIGIVICLVTVGLMVAFVSVFNPVGCA